MVFVEWWNTRGIFYAGGGKPVAKVIATEVRCQHCKAWFPSPIRFGNLDSFKGNTLMGNLSQCPACGGMTPCNKENMRVITDDGQFYMGDDAWNKS